MKFEIGDIVRVKTADERVKIESVVMDINGKIVDLACLGHHTESCIELIERPKRKKKVTYWFVSCMAGDGLRASSDLYIEKDMVSGRLLLESDRQVHSIEIEEDCDD